MKAALRSFRKTPWLSTVIVLSLAIGVGANTVIFSWLKSVVFEPLPLASREVLALETKDDTGGYVTTSWREYRDLVEMTPSLEAIALQRPRAFYLGETERESRVYAQLVTANFFEVLGVRAGQGRTFRADEGAHPGGAPVVVISHDFWTGYFKGAPDILGRTLKLNGHVFTVIGVMPEGFRGGMNVLGFDVWVTVTMAEVLQPATTELTRRATRNYYMLTRLKPGVTRAQAQGELNAAARRMIEAFPETNKGLGYELMPVWRVPRGGQVVVISLATLQVFGALILIVVCANTANLLLARASVRQREIGVRLALGAGPGRILRQLLAESVFIALCGAALGMLVAWWGVQALAHLPVPSNLPARIAPQLDWASLAFAMGLGAVCGIAFGLVPAWQLARGDVMGALRGGRGGIGGRSRARDLLVGLEVAVALVVLVLAGLFLKSFRNSLHVHPGFDVDRVLLGVVDLGGRGYSRETGHVFLEKLLARVANLPGVESASLASTVPLDVRGLPTGVISVEGKPFDAERKTHYYHAAPGYFATMGMPFRAGRDLAPLGRTDLPLDAVINEEMARRYWPEGSPLGRRFEVSGITYEIAGIVRNAKYTTLNETPRPAAWLTERAQFISAPTLHLRTRTGDPRALLTMLRATVHELDPELPVIDARTLAEHVNNGLFLQRVPAQILGVLSPLALVLAAIGLYAVIAYSLAQRTQEIGVRLTLGATPGSVVAMMLREGMKVVCIGAALGWLLALGFGWFLRASFVDVPFGDPVIFAGVPALLLAVAALACWLPARKAARVDPMLALRAE